MTTDIASLKDGESVGNEGAGLAAVDSDCDNDSKFYR